MITVYHVFTDRKDLWTQDYYFASKLYKYWKKSRGTVRLYKEIYENEEAMLNDEMLEVECLFAFGPFPW